MMEWNGFLMSNCKGNECYLNLYTHNERKYFTFIDRRNRGFHHYADITLGRVQFYKGYLDEDDKGNVIKWISPETYLYLFSGSQCDVRTYYRDANKLTISEIIDETHIIESLKTPNRVDNMDKCRWVLPSMLYELAIHDTYCFGTCDEVLEKSSIQEFIQNIDKYYGDSWVKLCYLNPFEFEEKYPEIVAKDKNDKTKKIKIIKERFSHFFKQ